MHQKLSTKLKIVFLVNSILLTGCETCETLETLEDPRLQKLSNKELIQLETEIENLPENSILLKILSF